MFPTCCVWLRNMLTTAGEQGLGVIASQNAVGERQFVVQARPFTGEQTATLSRLGREGVIDEVFRSGGTGWGIASVMDMPLQFCPYCGTDLRRLIDTNRPAFDALHAMHRKWRELE